MAIIPDKLKEVRTQLDEGHTPSAVTVRSFLSWFGAQRRGYWIVKDIRRCLSEVGVATVPDFEYAYIDGDILFAVSEGADANTPAAPHGHEIPVPDQQVSDPPEAQEVAPLPAAAYDPTYRVGKLAAANRAPVAVKPDSTLAEAITLMMTHEYDLPPFSAR